MSKGLELALQHFSQLQDSVLERDLRALAAKKRGKPAEQAPAADDDTSSEELAQLLEQYGAE